VGWRLGYAFAARAPSSDPGQGKWKKYFKGSWSARGVGGKSSPIDGGGSAWWKTTGETVGINRVKGGMGLVTSAHHLHFKSILSQPLMLIEPGDWARKNGLELVAHQDLIDAKTGLNPLDDHWLLAYMYLNPGENFGKPYLVFPPVDISWSPAAGEPPSRRDAHSLVRDCPARPLWATTAPVPGNYSSYRMVARLGYLMTAPDSAKPTVELEECISKWPGHLDRILIQKGVCETQDYQRLRSAGFIYASAQPNTQPLYRCYSAAEPSHFASNGEECNNMGKREALLGYGLKE
jgi:hypothetical protein